MQIDYREGKYDDALKNHAFIINLYPDNEIRPDADYLAGEVQFQRKNYNVAEQLFSQIKPSDPLYIYAQYTLAIINVENGKDAVAIDNLSAIIKDTSNLVSDQLLQDAANLKLGHLYFEKGDKYRLAVESYQRIPDGSPFQDEALLGTAWSWMKVNRPQESYQTVDRLIFNCTESPLIPEAYMVKGYACMLLKKPGEAVNALEQSIATSKRAFVTDADLQKKTEEFDQYNQKFAPTAELIKKKALQKPTNKIVEEQGSLGKDYQKYAKESRDMFLYSILAKSHSRFFKRKDEVLADAQYALAKATNMLKSQDVMKGQQQFGQQLDDIEKKKAEIKAKLEQLNKNNADTTGTK
jgi:tetratricopeptide (TPR) repeat protein